MILIVEDQEDMRRFIARELAETYRIREAANGKEAICILKDQPVSLILSDVMMPVMDGFELCNVVKNDVNYSHIPFILLTAQHNLQSRLKGLNNGADAYMEKPFSIELLVAQVANLLKSREVLTRTYKETPSTPATSLAVSTVDDLFLRKLNAYLEEHITNDALNVEMLATEMGMSTSSLYRKVKGLSGLSPVEFIKIARLKQAVLLMKNGKTESTKLHSGQVFPLGLFLHLLPEKKRKNTDGVYERMLAKGNVKRKVDPSPTLDETEISPPSYSRSPLLIANPRPIPL